VPPYWGWSGEAVVFTGAAVVAATVVVLAGAEVAGAAEVTAGAEVFTGGAVVVVADEPHPARTSANTSRMARRNSPFFINNSFIDIFFWYFSAHYY